MAALAVQPEAAAAAAAAAAAGLSTLNLLDKKVAAVFLRRTCSSSAWVEDLLAHRPYGSVQALRARAAAATVDMAASDWREAFYGGRRVRRERPGSAAALAAAAMLANAEQQYEDTFGIPFLSAVDGVGDGGPEADAADVARIAESLQLKNIAGEYRAAQRRLLSRCQAALGDMVRELGEKAGRDVGYLRARIESSSMQADSVPQPTADAIHERSGGRLHPERTRFWNGQRLAQVLKHNPVERDIETWGGLNYHRGVTGKIGTDVARGGASSPPPRPLTEPAMHAPAAAAAVPPQRVQQLFAGTWR